MSYTEFMVACMFQVKRFYCEADYNFYNNLTLTPGLGDCVRWSTACSEMFAVSNGVRQGGILSPLFFNVYMDGLSDILCRTECGCTMGGRMINHLMYADDIHAITFNHANTVCMYCRLLDVPDLF